MQRWRDACCRLSTGVSPKLIVKSRGLSRGRRRTERTRARSWKQIRPTPAAFSTRVECAGHPTTLVAKTRTGFCDYLSRWPGSKPVLSLLRPSWAPQPSPAALGSLFLCFRWGTEWVRWWRIACGATGRPVTVWWVGRRRCRLLARAGSGELSR